MYVTLVFRTKGTRLTKPTVSLTLLCLAMLVGVVRVAEYRNHWGDVLAGYFTGGAIAVFLVRTSIGVAAQQGGQEKLRERRNACCTSALRSSSRKQTLLKDIWILKKVGWPFYHLPRNNCDLKEYIIIYISEPVPRCKCMKRQRSNPRALYTWKYTFS